LAWTISQGDADTIVAVVDSGVKSDHEDLVGKVVPGYNFLNNNTDTNDVAGHGTIVSGVIGSFTNNRKGVASLGWNTKMMPIKVINQNNRLSYSNGARAIMYAADNGAKVINNSWGGTSDSTNLQNAVNYAVNRGVTVVASAGNTGCNGDSCIKFPARYNNVLAVGSSNTIDQRSSFSNAGPQLDVVAPGESIYTTYMSGGYASGTGTSFSAPFVSALAALILATTPGLSPAQVSDIIRDSADDLGTPGFDNLTGEGRINAYSALQLAEDVVPAPLPTPIPTMMLTPSPSPTSSPTPTPTPQAGK
jgi:subtilisin family serine protease